jgi:hypothetical protein
VARDRVVEQGAYAVVVVAPGEILEGANA